jgi:hypothetical protein
MLRRKTVKSRLRDSINAKNNPGMLDCAGNPSLPRKVGILLSAQTAGLSS